MPMLLSRQGSFMDKMGLSKITTYQAGATQAYMHRKLQKLCDYILHPYGISKMQWLIIGHVLDAQKQGVRISDLAEKLGTNLPFMTNSINKLEARSILERRDNTADTRSKLVVVSDNYVTTCEEIEATLRAGLRKTIYADIDPKEFAIYIKVMTELAAVDITDV